MVGFLQHVAEAIRPAADEEVQVWGVETGWWTLLMERGRNVEREGAAVGRGHEMARLQYGCGG